MSTELSAALNTGIERLAAGEALASIQAGSAAEVRPYLALFAELLVLNQEEARPEFRSGLRARLLGEDARDARRAGGLGWAGKAASIAAAAFLAGTAVNPTLADALLRSVRETIGAEIAGVVERVLSEVPAPFVKSPTPGTTPPTLLIDATGDAHEHGPSVVRVEGPAETGDAALPPETAAVVIPNFPPQPVPAPAQNPGNRARPAPEAQAPAGATGGEAIAGGDPGPAVPETPASASGGIDPAGAQPPGELPVQTGDHPLGDPPGQTGDHPLGNPPGQTGDHPLGNPPGQTGGHPLGDLPGQTGDHPFGDPPGRTGDRPLGGAPGLGQGHPGDQPPTTGNKATASGGGPPGGTAGQPEGVGRPPDIPPGKGAASGVGAAASSEPPGKPGQASSNEAAPGDDGNHGQPQGPASGKPKD